jgi:hypothetical protein
MSAREDTVKAERKKRVAAVLAYVVDGTAGAALDRVGAIVREAAAREMAAVLRGKPAGSVTPYEASAALANYAVEGDADLTWRAVRAGVRAAVVKLEPGLFPAALAGELVDALNALDAGENRGLATPADKARGHGKPGRYGPPSRRAELGRWLVRETGFQTGFLGLSFDAAVGLVTGVTRDGKPSKHAPVGGPLLPLGGEWDAVRTLIVRARKVDPMTWAVAKAQGKALARGEPIDPKFAADRGEVLSLANNRDAWRKVLERAEMLAP